MFSLRRFYLTLIAGLFFSSIAFSQAMPSFSGAEHIAFGNHVSLFFDRSDPGQSNKSLSLPNGLYISYGDIIAFGDLYGVVGKPISTARSESEARAHFLAAFNSFALDPQAVPEATKLLTVLHHELNDVEVGMERGEKPEDIFKRESNEVGRQLNCITGGGCSSTGWWLDPGRYLLLANEDFDHFGMYAWRAYTIGHKVAIEEALTASRTANLKHLELAYAMNAFASHFLSDLFAAGHLRTPRLELSTYVRPAVTGSLLAGYMHNEENLHGLHVHNLRGNRWVCYGDHFYFSNNNTQNSELLQEALQASADEIFSAYLNGAPTQDQTVINLVPHPDEINDQAALDISALFYWDKESKRLMRRADVTNPYDRHWTARWWGWSTLILLGGRGVPSEMQATLARSELKYEALAAGLINNPTIIDYIKQGKK